MDHAAEVLRPRPVADRAQDHPVEAARAQLLRLGRKPEERVRVAGDEQLHGVAVGRRDPFDVPLRVEADVGRHDREIQMAARLHRLDAHAPAFQVADAADRLAREQLVAADVQAGERGERQAGIQMVDDRAGEAGADVHVAARDHLRRGEAAGGSHVADVAEAFGAQERFGHVHRGETDGGVVRQADRGGLRAAPRRRAMRRAPTRPAAPAADRPVRKSRRFCVMRIDASVVRFRASASAATKLLTPSIRA